MIEHFQHSKDEIWWNFTFKKIKERWDMKNKIFIDLGCGFSTVGFRIPEAKKVIMVDNDPGVIKNIQTKIAKNMVCFCENVEDFKSEKSDYIFSTNMIEHSSYPHKMLRCMKKMLKDDGEYFITCPVLNISENKTKRKIIISIWRKILFEFLHHTKYRHIHKRVYSTKTLIKDIESVGLTVNKIDYISIIPFFKKFFAEIILVFGGKK